MKDAQATGEAFSTQQRTSSTSKHETYSFFVGHFCPPGSGSGPRRSKPTQQQHCFTTYKIVLHITEER
jgi:hypothetical protein